MLKNARLLRSLPVVIAIMLLLCQAVSAAPAKTENPDIVYGEDEDAGSGNYLTLVSSSVMSGARNVPVNPTIQLDFNKNVVHFSVSQNNLSSFHLVDSEGNIVPLQVIFPDDQLQGQVKRNIFLLPTTALKPNAPYILIVDNTFISKNGDYIDMAYQIKFTTGTLEETKTNSLLADLGKNIVTYTTDSPLNENSVPGSSRSGGRNQTPLLSRESAPLPFDEDFLAKSVFAVIGLGVALLIMGKVMRGRAMSAK